MLLYDSVKNQLTADWNQSNTIFSRRLKIGESVFVRGWALEYCRTFHKNPLIHCKDHTSYNVPGQNINIFSWLFGANYITKQLLENIDASSKFGIGLNLINQRNKGTFWFHQEALLRDGFDDVREHINLGTKLIFWHMNCPHLPAINIRKWETQLSSTIPEEQVYLDNIVVCDDYLGKIMTTLNATKRDYMLVVVSDHWFRQKIRNNVAEVETIPLLIGFSKKTNNVSFFVDHKINSVHVDRLIESYLDNDYSGFTQKIGQINDSWYQETKIVYDNDFHLVNK